MRQPEDIKKGLECCADPECVCDEVCPYAGIKFPKCREQLLIDAETLVNQVPKWISVKERLPEKDPMLCLVFRPYNGDNEWDMEVLCYRKGSYHWEDVTYWMPLPEPPKDTEK